MNEQVNSERKKIERLLRHFQIENSLKVALDGYYYRTVSYRYSRQPLSTKGAELTGGRYNFRPREGNSFPCLYCAERDLTASTEKFYNLKTQKAPLPPHTVVCIHVKLQKVLDLSSPEKCQLAGIDWEALNQPWEYHQDILGIAAYTQHIGAIAYQEGTIEGILFASTKVANTLNLAIFPQRLSPQSSLTLYDPNNELGNIE
ncbi:MAG: RES family NAD+ phosphorylase [Hydrococcus sp. RM1_1_31]|nr:RES family NAD+ phosphorylase [Hydrococcus sp. RM1_1_31]